MNVVFEAPGPGQWALDRSHMPGGCTALVQELMSATEPTAMRRVFAELGAPVETMSVAFVHGHIYTRLRPLIAPDRPSAKSPPKWVLKLVVRVHPEMRRRARTATDVFASAPWNAVIHDWHHGGRAAIVAGNLALQDVPIAQLDDAELMVHLRECWHNCLRNWEQHFWLHGYDLGPLGRFLYAADSWGVPADDLLSLLEGASPSTSGPAREGASIAALVRATGVEPATLDELRSLSTEIDAAVTAYLREREWVLFSRYDFDGLTLGERPDVVLGSILASAALDTTAQVQARTQVVRAAVPAKHHTEFDQLLASAREAYDAGDYRWVAELGARLVAAGRSDRRELAIELLPSELAATGVAELPDGNELQARADARGAQRLLAAPAVLGSPEAAPPLDVLPHALSQMVGAVQAVVRHLGMDGQVAASGLHGVGIGTRSVTAVARVAASPEDALDRLQPGEVLVVACTTPAYNLVLSLAGGIITAAGGPMSHAAVLARELGIPAVVGAHAALVMVPDGATVTIDPVAGTVSVLP